MIEREIWRGTDLRYKNRFEDFIFIFCAKAGLEPARV